MNEEPIFLSEDNGPIQNLFEEECTAIVVLSRQESGKTVNTASFTFFRVARSWYRISFPDRVMSCAIDEPSAVKYMRAENGYTYRQTDLSPLILAPTARITDIYAAEGINYTKCVLCLTNARSIQLRHYWGSFRTQLSIL